MTVAERIKRTCPKNSIRRYLTSYLEAMVFRTTNYDQLSVHEAVFIDGSTLTVRDYHYSGRRKW